jgi:hypothetical protein
MEGHTAPGTDGPSGKRHLNFSSEDEKHMLKGRMPSPSGDMEKGTRRTEE